MANEKIMTALPQQLRFACALEEFEAVHNREKAFEVKITDIRAPVQKGDLITLELIDPATGEATGDRITKKVTYVLDTKKCAGFTSKDALEQGLTIMSFAEPDNDVLPAIYSKYYTMSLGIDRFDASGEGAEPYNANKWEITEGPYYTPALVCPNFLEAGLLDTLNVERWPLGRYSVTLMLFVNYDDDNGPPYRVDIVDALVMVFVAHPTDPYEVKIETVEVEGLISNGRTVSLADGTIVKPLDIDSVTERLIVPMTDNELRHLDDANELISEEELLRYIGDARARGEDVSGMEAVLAGSGMLDDE